MKIKRLFVAVAIFAAVISCKNDNKTVKNLETEQDSVSYALGVNMATQFKTNFAEVDRDIFFQGFQNGLDSKDFLIPEADVMKTVSTFFQKKQQEKMKKQEAEQKAKAEKDFADWKLENTEFLKNNKSKSGVKTTDSGLQYIILKEGKGEKPKASDRIKIHYKGTNIKGEEFDSSYKRNKPYENRASGFVTGFSEGLYLMKPGAKYKFFIPQELAYEFRQRGAQIKPFSTLIFEVELLEIIK